jgi:hypothetical protein
VELCLECGAIRISYNSCRDRHCPKCCKYKKAVWVSKQEVVLLPTGYFHVVFTTDHLLNELVPANKRLIYNLLFKAVSQTLKDYGQRYWGGEIGITAVLHTWGQTLNEHVHLHCVVTGGALSPDGEQWHSCAPGYLFPIVALSADYRNRFCEGLRKLLEGGQLTLTDQQSEERIMALFDQMQAKNWEVHSNYFTGPQKVYEYLSRYVHQVAISNYRITDISKGHVTFTYRNNHDKDPQTGQGKPSQMTLPAVEFIRRFLWHVLPSRFVRIRHFGLHHSSAREKKLPQVRKLLGLDPTLPSPRELSLREWLETFIPPEELERCPYCHAQGSMTRHNEFEMVTVIGLLILGVFGLKGYRKVPL